MNPAIPNRPLFRAQEVCEIADVQAYVLRSWEAEFPDLGIAKTPGAPRVYRRVDVERVLRIKQLVFGEGLTLAGARRQLSEEAPSADAGPVSDSDFAGLLNEVTRQELLSVRRGLSWILGVLSGNGTTPEDFVLKSPLPEQRAAAESRRSNGAGKAAKSRAVKAARPQKKAARGRKR